MGEECLICKAPLEYYTVSSEMICEICGERYKSATKCKNGHFVCENCHTSGLSCISNAILSHTSSDPIAIIEELMSMSFCHMHGPEHHVMVGASLLGAYKNAGGSIDLEKAIALLKG